ncbi:uncharacterized protein [Mobula birostris]|uniref:uncharacterized protein isoform X2 n=1 Tax=Mobula birostris TaxID=1983395 RepID=UPI003B28CAFB
MSSLHITLLHSPLGSSVTRCADPPLLSVRQRTGSVSQSRSDTDRSGRGVDRLSVGPKNRQLRVEKFMSLLSLRIFPLVRLFPLLLQLGVIGAEVNREDAVAMLGSSVLLDSEVKVNPQMQEIVWTFISSHNSPVIILHHTPSYKKWVEPSEQFKLRLGFILSNGSLVINGLKVRDEGDYSLEVDGRELKIIHLSLFDNLLEATILTISSFPASTIWLICNVSGDPQKYQWWKNGAEISQFHQLIDGNRTLMIMNASRHDCGIYTCAATNPVSFIQANHTLFISGFHQEDVAIIVLSVISSVLSILQCSQCLLLKTDRAVRRVKCLRQFLGICTFMTYVTTVMTCVATLTKLIPTKGSDPVVVAVYCTVSLQLLTLGLLLVVQRLDCFRKRADQGCESSFIVWMVFFGAVIVGAVVFLFNFMVEHLSCRKENSEMDPPDPTASDELLMSDLKSVHQSSFSDDIPSSKP